MKLALFSRAAKLTRSYTSEKTNIAGWKIPSILMVGKNQEKMGDSHGDSHDVRFREGKKPTICFTSRLIHGPKHQGTNPMINSKGYISTYFGG